MLDTGYWMLDTGCLRLRRTISSIEHPASSIQHPEHGVSLVEVLIVLSLVGVLIMAIAPQMRGGRQVWEVVGDRHADVLQNARIGMMKMARELRQALEISVAGSNYVEFVDRNDNDMKFQYNAQYLEYGPTGSADVLAGPVDSLSFTYYMEDGVTTTTTADEIRSVLIQLVTSDSEGKVSPINLSSLVYIRKDPNIIYSLLDMAMFSSAGFILRNNSTVTGSIASDSVVEMRNGSVVNGDVFIQSADDLDMDVNATLNGSVLTDHNIALPDASIFSAGGEDQNIGNNETLELAPGTYGALGTQNRATLVLDSGDYYFDSISTGNDFILDLPSDGNVRIFVVGNVNYGADMQIAIDGATISLTSEAAREKAREVYTEIHGSWSMGSSGNGSDWIGTIFAPNSSIEIGNGSYVTGALYSGQSITVDNGSTVYFVRPNDDILPPQFLP